MLDIDMKHQRTKSNGPDYDKNGVLIEVKSGLQAIHWVRNNFLRMAYALSDRPDARAFLLLINPDVTEKRLRTEWQKAQKTFLHDILTRLSIVIYKDGRYIGIQNDPTPADMEKLESTRKIEMSLGRHRLQRPDYSSEILKILLQCWFLNQGRVTSVWLGDTAGCSYRTVAKTIEGLGSSVTRHSDKSVELSYFPKDAWNRLVVMSNKSRATIRYADRSGQPRSIESLLKRLNKLGRPDVAIGGVPGARRLHPDIDIVGTPRLDLSIHCPGISADIDFVKQLDPALETEEDYGTPASLVLHFVRRKEPLFHIDPDGITWADPAECLLDLQEVHLDYQALDLLNVLTPDRKIL
jgi:hypothetical protein